jgi:hypothetical protein
VITPQFADWLEGAKDASDRARRETDARRRVSSARRAANLWERVAQHLLARKESDSWPDVAVFLRCAAAEWVVANNSRRADTARANAARLDATLGTPRLVYRADPRPWIVSLDRLST